jgi:hypothetical protein
MNRRLLALAALALLVALSGCSFFGGGGEVDEENLLGDAHYEWEANANATYNLTASSGGYTAVVKITNRSSLSLHQPTAIRGDQAVSVDALRFRFLNGTIVNATHANLTATKKSDKTVISFPAKNGSVGWTSGRNGKSWSTPVVTEGSHRVDLPEGTRVGIPFLSRVRPSPDEKNMEDGRMRLYWDDIGSDSLVVEYYLVRDLYLFGSVILIGLTVGIGGVLYYFRAIRQARKKREEVGLDVEDGSDDAGNDGPPPGMR